MKKIHLEKGKGKKVIFSVQAEDAEEVLLAGDFNRWNPEKDPMKKNGSGVWQKSLILEPGTYEYKFKVDGKWLNDSLNPLVCDNCFGSKNNFVLI